MFHLPKEKTSWFGLKTLSYDSAKLWNKFYQAFFFKESDLKKNKLKNLLKIHSLNTNAWLSCLLFLLLALLRQENHFFFQTKYLKLINFITIKWYGGPFFHYFMYCWVFHFNHSFKSKTFLPRGFPCIFQHNGYYFFLQKVI